MSKLTMNDMNSLNAISGKLHKLGYHDAANILFGIQIRATEMIQPEPPKIMYVSYDIYSKLPKELIDACLDRNIKICIDQKFMITTAKELTIVHI